MSIPTTIFIDTSIFDESAYNLSSARFKAFRSLAEKLNLKLLIPDPTAREIRRHIRERSQSAVKSLENAARRAPFLSQLDDWPLNGTNKVALANKLESHTKKGLSDFYKNFETHKLDYRGVEIEEIMNWYDWKHAPFSDKKKNEFPDALSISSLNQYYKSSNENIAIVSHDGDFKSACAKHKHLLYFPSLPAYTEAIQREDERIDKIHQMLSDNDSIVRESISEEFPILSFLIEANWEGEAEDIELLEFNELEYYVVGIGHHNYIVSFDAEITFSAYVSYWDLESAVYEKGEAYPLHKIEGRSETETSISGTYKIETNENEEQITSCNRVEFDQDYISIDDESGYYK